MRPKNAPEHHPEHVPGLSLLVQQTIQAPTIKCRTCRLPGATTEQKNMKSKEMWTLEANKVNCYTISRPGGTEIHFDAGGTGFDSAQDLLDLLNELVDAANATNSEEK